MTGDGLTYWVGRSYVHCAEHGGCWDVTRCPWCFPTAVRTVVVAVNPEAGTVTLASVDAPKEGR